MDDISPCISICSIDEDRGWCRGCLRTRDEIAAWPDLDKKGRELLVTALSERRRKLPPSYFTDY